MFNYRRKLNIPCDSLLSVIRNVQYSGFTRKDILPPIVSSL